MWSGWNHNSNHLCISTHITSLSPFLDASVDEAGQVPALAVLHDNVQRGVSPVYDAVIVPYYVWVLELPQEVHL